MTYYTSPNFDAWKRQIVLGTILGGSSVVKPAKGRNCYLFMRSRNREWLAYKSQELKDFSSQRPFTEEGNTLRWHSNCYPVFNEFRELFYVNNKKVVKMEILDELKDTGLSIWYGDCGKIKGKKVILNTHKFGVNGGKLICKWLSLAQVDDKAEMSQERGNLRVVLSEAGSQRFLCTIAHRLPDFMHHKLE